MDIIHLVMIFKQKRLLNFRSLFLLKHNRDLNPRLCLMRAWVYETHEIDQTSLARYMYQWSDSNRQYCEEPAYEAGAITTSAHIGMWWINSSIGHFYLWESIIFLPLFMFFFNTIHERRSRNNLWICETIFWC